MSHLEISPQSDRLAIEPLVPRSRAEIIDRYRRLRAVSKRHNSGAHKCLSSEALMEQARRLGLVHRRTLILNSEDELTLAYDLALYARQGGRRRPLDRYAAAQRFAPDSDEQRVLEAMLAAQFALIRVERRHPEAGLIVRDLIREHEFWLVDEGMEASAPIGLKMATRVYSPDNFHMAAGVFVPLDNALLRNAIERRPLVLRMTSDQSAEDRRFAEAIYREAIQAGVMERVRFQDPPGEAGAAA